MVSTRIASKFNLGAQYCYGERNRAFFKRVQYRVGVSYATPYYKMNGVDGPKEISVSAGFGIPIMNADNNRSMLNISGQWVKSSAKDLIKEILSVSISDLHSTRIGLRSGRWM